MKKIQATLATAWLTASLALAVPSEINYQGVLTDSQGNPVNGNQTMSLKIFDAATGGTLLYSENLGTVPVNNGVYNFIFGANGTSNALTTETVATTNGTASTFQKVLSASTVVAGSVTVTDGNYTWDQTNGSSNENDFGVSYNSSLRRVTVNYYNGAPAAGKMLSVSYRTPSAGISIAISDGGQPWLETTINGTAQTPRQKILTVPFASYAKQLSPNSTGKSVNITRFFGFGSIPNNSQGLDYSNPNGFFPISSSIINGQNRGKGMFLTPEFSKRINSIKIDFSGGSVNIKIHDPNNTKVFDYLFNENQISVINLDIPFGERCSVFFEPFNGATINSIKLNLDFYFNFIER